MASRKTLDSPDHYTIGWIAALDIELAAATAMLDEEHEQPRGFARHETDKNVYAWGQMGHHAIVIACLPAGRYGTSLAATTASSLLASLPQIKIGLLVGIGRGIARPDENRDIRLGDIVVSQPDGTTGGVCQHDLFKAKSGDNRELFYIRRPSNVPDLLQRMLVKNPNMGKNTKQSPEVQRNKRITINPEIHYGIIASGNTFVIDAAARDRLVADIGEDYLCVKMEAAGLMDYFPCLKLYAAATTATYAKEFLTFVPAAEVKVAKRILDVF
ncbi:nucleoside phosphorylase domain-containing protein [Bombardia bombarda]|uniref:Nucleoside phosphorylase domain-containing protein n=1 Tax=Bombardia bombarda TaxID=252184 RepID=A0AA39X8R9_9PEZI|nr:nucleoside phosphorylase domain-containing protein [Bombardia bombarda]